MTATDPQRTTVELYSTTTDLFWTGLPILGRLTAHQSPNPNPITALTLTLQSQCCCGNRLPFWSSSSHYSHFLTENKIENASFFDSSIFDPSLNISSTFHYVPRTAYPRIAIFSGENLRVLFIKSKRRKK